MTAHDRRRFAFRPDLADARLRGQVEASRFVEAWPGRIGVAVSDMRSQPRADAGLSTQALLGDDVRIFDTAEGWAWIQNERDGYVGYVAESDLSDREGELTHMVCAPRTFVYPGPDLKLPRTGELSLGSRLRVEGHVTVRGTRYGLLPTGEAVIGTHLSALEAPRADYVSVAEMLVSTPYLWGGASAFGLDCSGLVQLSMFVAGHQVLRDSDMQAATVGAPIRPDGNLSDLKRGDLVFWKGHVGIMTDSETLLHANGHTMTVAREPLLDAISRTDPLYGSPTVFRRP